MFLKRLEMIGFKSFAEKVIVDFVPGVTAIVGPNGSGKSNIADSVRWVLGEQSAKSLRGSKMEDVIFAGSDHRSPLNFAEVTLTLNNEDQYLSIDYSEVSVTRRVFRSGESEYLINNQPCRLKDIVSLFLDSGLGKEAYSIIGQGKIEEVIATKPEERRVIFEEAAGVLMYKTRKITAERRLEETKENLLRVKDILHEIETQVEPLKQQVEAAEKYIHARDELKQVDVALLAYEIKQLHKQWAAEKEKLEKMKKRHAEYEEALAEMERKRLTLRDRTKALTVEYNDTQNELLKVSEAHEKSDGERRLFLERQKNLAQTKEEVADMMTVKTNELNDAISQVEQVNKELETAKKKVNKLLHAVSKKEQMLIELDSIKEEDIERLKGDYIELLNEQASIRNEQRYLKEQKRQQHMKKEQLLKENEGLLEKRAALHEQYAKQKEKVLQRKTKWEQLGTVFRKEEQLLENEQAKYRKKETTLYEAYQLQHRIETRIDILQEMEASFAGFYDGVKAVLKEKNNLTGVHGALVELITVPKQYERALEIALGAQAQHIVVRSEKDARKAIQFLRRNRKGRATFLPISVMRRRAVAANVIQTIKKHDAFIGTAASLLTYDEMYTDVIHHLLGHVVIAAHLEGANELATLMNYRYRIVTIDGEVVHPGGSMTGGSISKRRAPLFSRKRELTELKQREKKIATHIDQLERDVKKLKENNELQKETVHSLREQVDNAQATYMKEEEVLRAIASDIELTKVHYSQFDREKQSFTKDVNEIIARLNELEKSYEKISTNAVQLERKVTSLEKKKDEKQHVEQSIQAELVEDKVTLARAKERHEAINERANHIKKEKLTLETELNELTKRHDQLTEQLKGRINDESSFDEQIDESRKRKESLTKRLKQIKVEHEKVNEKYAQIEKKLTEQQKEQQQLAKTYQQIEVNVNRMDVQLDHRLNHLQDEYEMTFEAATKYTLTCSVEDAKVKVNNLKSEIESLGTVNLGAIDEYARLKERYTFLYEQQADLEDAKETLYKVIQEMDEEMTVRFEHTFTHIRKQFQQVFTELFGGGEADLILTDETDLLHTGVDIVARPPGKKSQHLSLLSGGEKALTALGLLFAILRVRPVPFCVLDEVEASLDEPNVSRFAHFLKTFSNKTQFIVITHRKGTMEEADVLYGVTMEESGVSKFVSVKLEDTDHLIETAQ